MKITFFGLKNRFSGLLSFLLFSLFFKKWGKSVRVIDPLRIEGMKNISIGNKVVIQNQTWLAALPLTGTKTCQLDIGEGSVIGHFNHIYCTNKITLGKKVLTADKVYISDNLHTYKNINIPIIDQPVKQIGVVTIGDGTWLGENVCVIGAAIGKNCVIGANSVVTKDIPDYCIAVGAPARIIKRYSTEKGIWEQIK